MNAWIRPWFRLDNIARALWAAVMLTLPVTSFRYFPFMGAETYVRPLSAYPLALLLIVLFIQFLRDHTRLAWPAAFTPLAAFVLAAVAATVIGVLFGPLVLRGQAYWGRALRAWATLIIGLAFFLSAVWMNRTEGDLRFTIRWMLLGFVLDILWSGVQGVTFYLHVLPKPLVTHLQLAFSMRELIRTNRISGMAYEPAWLAGEIATIYLPWLFASLLSRLHVTRFKWFELILLICAAMLLLATFSRGGLATAGVTVILTLLFTGGEYIRSAWQWFISGFRNAAGVVVRAIMIMAVVVSVFGALLFLSRKNYISRLWNTRASDVQDYLIQNSAGARAAYIWGAMGAYRDHPWTGVGLGADGFYIYQNLPDWIMTMVPEIASQLSPTSALYPNAKNLYVRLLAETGLIGFVLFLAFQLFILGDMIATLKQHTALWQYLGIAALFSWLGIIFYNMTQDSFATPFIWLNLGIFVGISAFSLQFATKGP
ncbi:MAG TPA: O-antigen ligase family protein [Anaerolineales bacterium]|nr:O-antigen ligase family protein [Anaerolineales bacterium]